jgi:hypothetical protein
VSRTQGVLGDSLKSHQRLDLPLKRSLGRRLRILNGIANTWSVG